MSDVIAFVALLAAMFTGFVLLVKRTEGPTEVELDRNGQKLTKTWKE